MTVRRTTIKKKVKKVKILSRKAQKRNLDNALRELCFKRDGYKCLRCGRTTHLQMSHILPRGEYPWMAYELENVLTLCVKDHLFWWHKNPVMAYLWLIETISSDRMDELDRFRLYRKAIKETYEETLERLKNKKI